MTSRAAALGTALTRSGYTFTARPASATTHDLPAEAAAALMGIYRQLGGTAEVLSAGRWDFSAGALLIELDEQEHFNRYRTLTLESPWAGSLPWTTDYGLYCRSMEAKCRAYSGYWSNPSADRQFGGSDAPGIHGPLGTSRWKQRAVYDALRDAWAVATCRPLARISIYDTVGGVNLGAALEGKQSLNPDALREHIEQRTCR